jgi:hypothetical protein
LSHGKAESVLWAVTYFGLIVRRVQLTLESYCSFIVWTRRASQSLRRAFTEDASELLIAARHECVKIDVALANASLNEQSYSGLNHARRAA